MKQYSTIDKEKLEEVMIMMGNLVNQDCLE